MKEFLRLPFVSGLPQHACYWSETGNKNNSIMVADSNAIPTTMTTFLDLTLYFSYLIDSDGSWVTPESQRWLLKPEVKSTLYRLQPHK